MIEGVGEKSFCAGGDIRAITDVKGSQVQKDFFREEYMLNHLTGVSI
jgi:3-hydroxyisobutyryl-CoA hydrolase